MSVTLADTYINALMNTSHRLSENIWFNSMARTQRTSIGCPKVRVEIFTLARGARACIESTQFIIMTS